MHCHINLIIEHKLNELLLEKSWISKYAILSMRRGVLDEDVWLEWVDYSRLNEGVWLEWVDYSKLDENVWLEWVDYSWLNEGV